MNAVRRLAVAIFWRGRAWYELLVARTESLRRLGAVPARRVLVICHGNIYRSAFVEHYLRSLVGSEIEIRSGGFHPVGGRSSPDRHVEYSRSYGVDLSNHRSSTLRTEDLEWADLLVLMDRKNWVRLTQMGADPEKLIWLGALAPGSVEIQDPYEMDDAALCALIKKLQVRTRQLATLLKAAR